MSRPRILRAAVLAPALVPVLLVATGCTDDEGAAAGGSATAGPTTAPELAGVEEAELLGTLPEGPATGTAVLSYIGVGELRAPFLGECVTSGNTVRLEGMADTARIRVDVAPDGLELTLDDVGLSMVADLTTGQYDVTGNHLSLQAGLAHDGEPVGSADLEIDCGA
ncbi:hypothetical protein GCU60_16185 [Blastococcus saxobsidens]|uniref:Lipoprotein n=1 Tax=Blastococcus saxobsidens TaxID=138336 RepID=A0A6L9W650_9ACTN|nr:hypothetical protein [Blastococcus saxobsidens]NEK87282.1 hypothetical protein [Blastococcus saxobsidens]